MRLSFVVPVWCLATFLQSGLAAANCHEDGERTQGMVLSFSGKTIDYWEMDPNEIHWTALGNGSRIGIKIEPAGPEKYRELLERHGGRGVDELVKISVCDMRDAQPELRHVSWGGANSRQGLRSPGIELWLHKPVCVGAYGISRAR